MIPIMGRGRVYTFQPRREYEVHARLNINESDSRHSLPDKGDSSNSEGSSRAGIAACHKALEIDPTNITVWDHKLAAHRKLHEIREAIDCCEQIVELQEIDDFNTYTLLADLNELILQHDDALEALEYASVIDSSHVLTWVKRGVLKSALGDLEDSLHFFDVALGLDATNQSAMISKGMVLIALDRYKEALVSFESALQKNDKQILSLLGNGRCHYELEERDKAIDCCDKIIAAKPDVRDALALKAMSLGKRGRYPDALDYFMRSLKIDPIVRASYSPSQIELIRRIEIFASKPFFHEMYRTLYKLNLKKLLSSEQADRHTFIHEESNRSNIEQEVRATIKDHPSGQLLVLAVFIRRQLLRLLREGGHKYRYGSAETISFKELYDEVLKIEGIPADDLYALQNSHGEVLQFWNDRVHISHPENHPRELSKQTILEMIDVGIQIYVRLRGISL